MANADALSLDPAIAGWDRTSILARSNETHRECGQRTDLKIVREIVRS